MVTHVLGGGLINERVVCILSREKLRRRFMSIFALVMSGTVVLATLRHAIEGTV